jgi:hypothetical protein
VRVISLWKKSFCVENRVKKAKKSMGIIEMHTLVKLFPFWTLKNLQRPLRALWGTVESGSNNTKGTGPASVFEFLTEAFFSFCLRTAAEKNSFEDQVLQAAYGSENFATSYLWFLSLFFDSFAWVPVWGLFANFDPKDIEFPLLQKNVKIKSLCLLSGLGPWRAACPLNKGTWLENLIKILWRLDSPLADLVNQNCWRYFDFLWLKRLGPHLRAHFWNPFE